MTGEQRPADRSHEVRKHYLCSRRRIEGKAICDQPYLTQERLETDLLEVLKAIALPAWAQPPVRYEIAVVKSTGKRAAAVAFIDKVLSKAGQAKLRAAGFGAVKHGVARYTGR